MTRTRPWILQQRTLHQGSKDTWPLVSLWKSNSNSFFEQNKLDKLDNSFTDDNPPWEKQGCKLPGVPEISEHIVVLLLDVGEEAGVVHHGVHEAHLRLFWQRSVPTWTEPVELLTPLTVSSRRVPGLGRCGARVIRGAHTLQSTEYSDTSCHVSQSIARTNLILRVRK